MNAQSLKSMRSRIFLASLHLLLNLIGPSTKIFLFLKLTDTFSLQQLQLLIKNPSSGNVLIDYNTVFNFQEYDSLLLTSSHPEI